MFPKSNPKPVNIAKRREGNQCVESFRSTTHPTAGHSRHADLVSDFEGYEGVWPNPAAWAAIRASVRSAT